MLKKLYALICDGCGTTGPSFDTLTEARSRYRQTYKWKRVPKRGDQPAVDRCTRCQRRE